MTIIEKISDSKYIPILQSCDRKLLPEIISLFRKYDFKCVEIAQRDSDSMELLQDFKKLAPDFLVGAGSVSTAQEIHMAYENGAEFIMSAGVNDTVIKEAENLGLPVFPGVYTPTDIEVALNYGIKILKYFPAGSEEALKMVDAMYGPYPDLMFIPTGGVGADMAREYLDYANVLTCGGSWPLKQHLLDEYDLLEIENRIEKIGNL